MPCYESERNKQYQSNLGPATSRSRARRGQEDQADEWVHVAGREAAGPNCRIGRREEEIWDSEDISRELADLVLYVRPLWRAILTKMIKL